MTMKKARRTKVRKQPELFDYQEHLLLVEKL